MDEWSSACPAPFLLMSPVRKEEVYLIYPSHIFYVSVVEKVRGEDSALRASPQA